MDEKERSITKSSSGERKSISIKWVEAIFDQLLAFYGTKFVKLWEGADPHRVKEVWARELGGLAQDDIVRGVRACRARDWPPTLPEFLALCQPRIDYQDAYYEACIQMDARQTDSDRWSSPAIYWAAVRIGEFDLRNSPYPSIETRWRSALDRAIGEVQSGILSATIPPRLKSLPAPGEQSIPPEVARAKIKEMIAGLAKRVTT